MSRRRHWTNRLIPWGAAGCILLGTFLRALPGEELRTWTDSTGKYRIEAEFVSEANGTVVLRRSDGRRFEIKLLQLSQSDRELVKMLQARQEATSPFKAMEHASSPAGQPENLAVTAAEAREIAALPQQASWSFSPPASPPSSMPTPHAITYNSNGFKYEGLATNVTAQRIVLSFARQDKNRYSDPEIQTEGRYVLGNTADGQSVDYELGPFDAAMRVVAIDDAGTSAIALRSKWGFGNSDRLELWRFAQSGIERLYQWTPYGQANGGDRDVNWVRFLPNQRAVTVSGGGNLVVWNLAQGIQPLYRFAIKGGSTPGLSPDRKLICFARGEDIGVLDVDQGQVLASQKVGNNLPWPALRFSPDAGRIACVDHLRMRVWDFRSGSLIRDVPRVGIPTGGFCFVSTNHLLIGGKLLYDIDHQLTLWSYEGAAAADDFGSACCFVAGSGGTGSAMFQQLPQPAVHEALEKALQDPDFWVLKPGTTVQLELAKLPDPVERERIGRVLTEKLTALGMQVGNRGTISLVASVSESPEKEQVSYGRGFSPFGRGVPLNVRKFTSQLVFDYRGSVAWQQSGTNIPSSLSLQDGEAITDALKRHEKPNYAWFDRVELPAVLRRPTGSPTLGTTRVSDTGLQ